ncbi:sulfonate ABC transporter substrate-binding protein [Floridanema aerugineum]|uniref:Sulfonate ABC transporter substrate-binding protein n=1 Tax=Floridaenema aerugineum BLCC-F46 TaxID=3153654 RepID=A0ABV4XEY7_9CYAN
MRLKRREVLLGLTSLGVTLISASCNSNSPNQTAQTNQPANQTAASPVASSGSTASGSKVRIGYQRFSELDLIRTRGELEKRLKERGFAIDWVFFQSGPPMLEAMNAGSLDWGGVGDTPPIFAQAAGAQFYYVGMTPRGPKTQDIVVLKDSPIQKPADLKGKKVALQKGSSAHYLLISMLEENNIPADSVEVVSLSPSDARAAFEQGKIDAWSIWDPFLAVIENTGKIRNLNVGKDRRAFFLASQKFAQENPDLVKIILEEAKNNEEWGQKNTKEIAQQFSQQLNIDASILEIVNQRRKWGLSPIDDSVLTAQQQVADTFYQLKIIPKQIQVKDVALPFDTYAKLYPS